MLCKLSDSKKQNVDFFVDPFSFYAGNPQSGASHQVPVSWTYTFDKASNKSLLFETTMNTWFSGGNIITPTVSVNSSHSYTLLSARLFTPYTEVVLYINGISINDSITINTSRAYNQYLQGVVHITES